MLVQRDRRREIAVAILSVVWVSNVAGVVVLVASLVARSGAEMSGRELLVSGGVVWLANAIAFGLAMWELDSGGPVGRALAPTRRWRLPRPRFRS